MRTEMHSFDTHAHVKALIKAGLEEPQAEAIIKTIVNSREYDFSKLATKEELKAEIAGLKSDILTWMIPLLLTIIAMIGTVIFKMFVH